jgi:hypothetical protein
MSDDKRKAEMQYRMRIYVHEDSELRDWSKKYSCTSEELKAAVKAVGNMAGDVAKYLAGQGSGVMSQAQ